MAGSPSSIARSWPIPTRRCPRTPSWAAAPTRSCSRAWWAARSGPRTASSACSRARCCAPRATRWRSCDRSRRGARARPTAPLPSRSPSASPRPIRSRTLAAYLAELAPAVPPGLPRFFGGAVGWLAYDVVRALRAPARHQARRAGAARPVPGDHRHRRHLRQPARDREGGRRRRGGGRARDPDLAYDDACARIDDVLARLARPAPAAAAVRVPAPGGVAVTVPPGNTTRAAFEADVRRIQEYILAGDAFQVVYSQRFRVPARRRRSLRRLPRAAGDQPVAVHVPPRVPRGRRHRRVARGAGAARSTARSSCAPSPGRAGAAPRPRRTPRSRRSCAPTPRNGPSTSC